MYCARRGITNAILLGFGRAIAEVGAVLMVGGNIAGRTRVLTTSVVLETSVGRLDIALQLGLVLLIISLITAFTLQLVQYVRFFEGHEFGTEEPLDLPIEPFTVNWDDLCVMKDGKLIVDSCNIKLSGNEIVALMGESGSGKSTLLRAMCGLEVSTNSNLQDIAYVSQNPVLVMDTVAMELGLPSRLHEDLPNAGLFYGSICNFEKKGNQRTESLSGGEIQRLAFLRALAMDRKILILDEITSELDGRSIERIEDEILKFKNKGGSVFLATHNPQQAERLADRVMYIHDGKFIDKNHEIAKDIRSGLRIG
jgi:tungstate transport system ATP-binding protein